MMLAVILLVLRGEPERDRQSGEQRDHVNTGRFLGFHKHFSLRLS
jgi:hypothetical protein